jgi:hypothetical protein
MKLLWQYTLARFAVLLLTYGVVAFVAFVWPGFFTPGVGTNLIALGIAAVVAGVISMFALSGLRERFAAQMAERAGRMSQRVEQARRAEDAD